MSTWIESRIPEDDIREDFFIEETYEAQECQSILMLLGDAHVEAVGAKLVRLGLAFPPTTTCAP